MQLPQMQASLVKNLFLIIITLNRHLKEPQCTLESMLRPKVATLPGHIQSIYVQNLLKVYWRVLTEHGENEELVKDTNQLMLDRLPMFVQSADLEVQERVWYLYMFKNALFKTISQ